MSAVVKLLGIVEDGSVGDPHLPLSSATTIAVTQYAPTRFDVACFYRSGVPVDLGSLVSMSAVLTWRRQLDPCQILPDFSVAGVAAAQVDGKNVLQFSIFTKDTRNLPLGRYFFDVWLSTSTEQWQVVRVGVLVLQAGLQRG